MNNKLIAQHRSKVFLLWITILSPCLISLWLVFFRTHNLIWGDFYSESRFLTQGLLGLFEMNWDHYHLIIKILFYTLYKFGIWNFQFYSFLTVILIGLSVALLKTLLSRFTTNKLKSQIFMLWSSVTIFFTTTIAYRQMMNTLPFVFLELMILLHLLCRPVIRKHNLIAATIVCTLGPLTNSHGIFLWIVAIIIVLHSYKDDLSYRFLTIWLTGFLVSLFFYIGNVNNLDNVESGLSLKHIDILFKNLIHIIGKPLMPNAPHGILSSLGIMLLIIYFHMISDIFRKKKNQSSIRCVSFALSTFGLLSSGLVLLGRFSHTHNHYVYGIKFMGITIFVALGTVMYLYFSIKKYKLIVQFILIALIAIQIFHYPAYLKLWNRKQSLLLAGHACLQTQKFATRKCTIHVAHYDMFGKDYTRNVTLGFIQPLELSTNIVWQTQGTILKGKILSTEKREDEMKITGYATDQSCKPIEHILLTNSQKEILSHTTVAFRDSKLKQELQDCTNVLVWEAWINKQNIDTIDSNMLLWAYNPITNTAEIILDELN